jgi:hypothetical protein
MKNAAAAMAVAAGGGGRALPQPNSPARTLLKALPWKCAFSDYRFYLLPLSASARCFKKVRKSFNAVA